MSFVTFGSLLFAPVLGLVRVNVDTHGATTGASLETKEMVRTAFDANATKGKDPYWVTWTANSGLGDAKNWKALDLDVPLVGKKYKVPLVGWHLGGLPDGMAAVEMKMQRLEFKFTCQDAVHGGGLFGERSGPFAELDKPLAWVSYDTHRNGYKSTKRYRAMENEDVEVVYEYAGDPGKEFLKNSHNVMNSLLECKKVDLEVTQIMYASDEDLEQNAAYVVSLLHDVDPEFYTIDKINQGVRAINAQLGEDFGTRREFDPEESMRRHDRQIQGMVTAGLLKKKADYGLLQDIFGWQQKRAHAKITAGSNGDMDGVARFTFGRGRLTDLAKPGAGVNVEGWDGGVPKGQGQAKLAFEFTQDCTIDFEHYPWSGLQKQSIPQELQGTLVKQDLAIRMGDEVYIHGQSAHKGERGAVEGAADGGMRVKLQSGQTVEIPYPNLALNKSPANCWPGQKGLLVLAGDQSEWNKQYFPGAPPHGPPSGNWKAERLVLYLAKGH